MTPFDLINNVSFTKTPDLDKDEEFNKNYVPFVINKGLSYHVDTLLYANQMNSLPHLDKDLQYRYYLNKIRPAKRFAKWVKRGNEDGDLEAIKEYYGYGDVKARTALSILSPEQLSIIKKRLSKGGTNNEFNGDQ